MRGVGDKELGAQAGKKENLLTADKPGRRERTCAWNARQDTSKQWWKVAVASYGKTQVYSSKSKSIHAKLTRLFLLTDVHPG